MARWKPTEEQAILAEKLSALGMRQEQIANVIGISYNTLLDAQKKNKALRQRLLKAMDAGNSKVHDTLFKMATRGDCPAATIFWIKVRSRWREPAQQLEHSAPEGIPVQTSEESPVEKEARINAKLTRLKQLL